MKKWNLEKFWWHFFWNTKIKGHLKVLLALYIQELFFVNTVNEYGFLRSDFSFSTHREKNIQLPQKWHGVLFICDNNYVQQITKFEPELLEISKRESFATSVNGFHLLTIVAKLSILDVCEKSLFQWPISNLFNFSRSKVRGGIDSFLSIFCNWLLYHNISSFFTIPPSRFDYFPTC